MTAAGRAVLAATAAGAAAGVLGCGQAGPRTYRGLSGQHLPVVLRVSGDHRSLALDIRWAGPCAGELYIGGVKRTRRPFVVPIARDGSFTWSGRHRVALDGVDDDLLVAVRLTGRVRDGRISATWRTGVATAAPDSYGDGCDGVATRFSLRAEGPVRLAGPRAIGPGMLATPLGDDGTEVAVGAGRVWVLGDTYTDDGSAPRHTVTRVDPASGRVAGVTRVRGGVLAAGAGRGWVVGYEVSHTPGSRKGVGRPAITRVDPATRTAPVALPAGPVWQGFRPLLGGGLAVTRRALWILRGSRVLRADPRTGRVVQSIRLARGRRCRSGRLPSPALGVQIAAGGGAVWVISERERCGDYGAQQRLLRIDPDSGRVTSSVGLHTRYDQLAAGARGVWAATAVYPTNAVHRIDPQTGRAGAIVSPAPVEYVRSLAVRGSTVWIVGGPDHHGLLLRASAARRRATVVRRLRGPGSTVAADRRGVWVVDRGVRELLRVAP